MGLVLCFSIEIVILTRVQGHIICRACLRTWVEVKYRTGAERALPNLNLHPILDDNPRLVACTLCETKEEFRSLIVRPTLAHESSDRRMTSFSHRTPTQQDFL
jgi:hypothetical protein